MADDLDALITRLKELPAGTMLTVLIPKGQIANVAGLLVQDNETYHIPGALFAAPAQPAPPPKGDVPAAERYMVVLRELNIRRDPEPKGDPLGTVKAGERVAVTGELINGYVKLSGRDGYVLASGLTAA